MGRTVFVAFILGLGLSAQAAPEATFDVTLTPAGDFTGKAETVVGHATMEGGKVKAENIKVPLKGIKTGVELRDKHTQKHLQTDKFPEAVLVRGEGQNGKGKGVLQIKGIEKEVSGTYKVSGDELAADFKIKLSDFNITGIKYMGVGVDDEVVLHVKVPVKAGAATAPAKKPASVPVKKKK